VANQVVQALLTQKVGSCRTQKKEPKHFELAGLRLRWLITHLFQEAQRNGKARSAAAGRWPSLLSLTCPRSSGSESLSSAGSEYSSGSHTWADGRGFSKQGASSRDKRMSTGSVSSNHSVFIEPTDLGWKEGHILKGLKHLQMNTEATAAVPHCKDCMTSNEGIYSSGVKSLQQGSPARKSSTRKPLTAEPQASILDAADPDESGEQSTEKRLHLDSLAVSADDDKGSREDSILPASSGLFPSPDSDRLLFLDAPTVKPGVSPTDSLTKSEGLNRNSLDGRISGVKLSDRNNNQEQATDRKSRLDCSQRQQGRLPLKQAEADEVSCSATRALNEARQRSASMEVPHCRDQANPAGRDGSDWTGSESPQRKPKPQFCDSARKAFILRSKSADGGQDQLKHTHSPLHQKLIKGQRPKGQATAPGHSVASKRANQHGSSQGADQDVSTPVGSKCLEQQLSPLASPVKQSKILKSPGLKSPTKPSTRASSNDCAEESICDHLPCSPRKQRRQGDQGDSFRSERRSPSPPPPPPGRTTSLVLKAASDCATKDRELATQPQSSATGKSTTATDFSSVVETQQSSTMRDHQLADLQTRDVSLKTFLTDGSKIPHLPVQESQTSDSVEPDRITTCRSDNGSADQNILQRSQQSISEPKLSEVLPTGFSNVYYHGAPSNPHTSSSNAVKRTLPVNAKSHEAISGQSASTFLIFGRQSNDDPNSLQTFQTFTCDPLVVHKFGSREKSCRKIETRCSSLDSEPLQPAASDGGGMLDWGFDEQGWLFKRSVSVSTRPLLKPVMGMNGAKARSQSFGARYLDRPSFNRSGKVRTQIRTHSGSSLNSLGDVLPGSMSCSSSYHCPVNRSLLSNFLIEEGLTVPSHLGSSSERLQSVKLQREQARRLQIEQQFSSAFGEPVSEEPERHGAITTIEEKVMLGIEENLHKSQEKTSEGKQKSGSGFASWFGFRKTKLPAPSAKKTDAAKAKEEKQKITSLLGGRSAKPDKKKDRRKSDGKECR
ncbi:nck-associated protein 5, partial [Poecilia reticulata]|uniref:nck-associated protein 5 n=1 Tax=Poecilia reticulata TaxID=8081 RepID=UPI0007EBCF36